MERRPLMGALIGAATASPAVEQTNGPALADSV